MYGNSNLRRQNVTFQHSFWQDIYLWHQKMCPINSRLFSALFKFHCIKINFEKIFSIIVLETKIEILDKQMHFVYHKTLMIICMLNDTEKCLWRSLFFQNYSTKYRKIHAWYLMHNIYVGGTSHSQMRVRNAALGVFLTYDSKKWTPPPFHETNKVRYYKLIY